MILHSKPPKIFVKKHQESLKRIKPRAGWPNDTPISLWYVNWFFCPLKRIKFFAQFFAQFLPKNRKKVYKRQRKGFIGQAIYILELWERGSILRANRQFARTRVAELALALGRALFSR